MRRLTPPEIVTPAVPAVPGDDGLIDVAREFTASQRVSLDQAIRAAEQVSRCEFSVFVGAADGNARHFAERLHAALSTPRRSVLVMVDPTARLIEVVTGAEVRRSLSDREVALAVLEMRTEFAGGDLVRGLRRGITMLAMAARAPRTLHA
jgi:uncharacterized membrane protein YgcG